MIDNASYDSEEDSDEESDEDDDSDWVTDQIYKQWDELRLKLIYSL